LRSEETHRVFYPPDFESYPPENFGGFLGGLMYLLAMTKLELETYREDFIIEVSKALVIAHVQNRADVYLNMYGSRTLEYNPDKNAVEDLVQIAVKLHAELKKNTLE
jgi:hypothetical protein